MCLRKESGRDERWVESAMVFLDNMKIPLHKNTVTNQSPHPPTTIQISLPPTPSTTIQIKRHHFIHRNNFTTTTHYTYRLVSTLHSIRVTLTPPNPMVYSTSRPYSAMLIPLSRAALALRSYLGYGWCKYRGRKRGHIIDGKERK